MLEAARRRVPEDMDESPVFINNPDEPGAPSLYVPVNNAVYSFGLIYRWIPYNSGYGFIVDTELFNPDIPFADAIRQGRYFSTGEVADPALQTELSDLFYSNSSYDKKNDLETYIPVLFIPRYNAAPGVSTPHTAHHVILATSLDSRIRLALSFRKEGDIEFARNVLNDVLSMVPGYRKLKTLYGKAPDYIFKDADVPALAEQWSAELQAQALENVALSGAVNPTEPSTAEGWYDLGVACLRRNKSHETDQAEICFEKAKVLKPGLSRHLLAEGCVRMSRKEYEEAIVSFNQALKLNPANYTCHFLKGECRIKLRDFPAALRSFDQAIEMRSDYLEARVKKISVLYLTKQYPEVISEATDTLIFFPENPSLYSWRASAHLRRKEFRKALEDIEKALERRPRDPESLFTQGYILAQMGRIREAALIWDETLALNPNDVKTISKRAFYLSVEGRTGEALSMIAKALSLGPENPKTWYYRGCIYQNAGNYEEALASFSRSLDIDPAADYAIRERDRVRDYLDGSSGRPEQLHDAGEFPGSADTAASEETPETDFDLLFQIGSGK